VTLAQVGFGDNSWLRLVQASKLKGETGTRIEKCSDKIFVQYWTQPI